MSQTSSLQKGALVTANGGAQSSIPIQYNLDTPRRTLQPQWVGGQRNDRSQRVRYVGAAVRLSAGRELEQVDAAANYRNEHDDVDLDGRCSQELACVGLK